MSNRLFSSTVFALVMTPGFMLDADVIDDWRLRHPTPYYADFFNAAYGNGVYVVVGAGGMIATSSDLQNWHTMHHPELLENVVFGSGQFVTTGYNGDILTSTDGTNWTTHASGTILSLSGVDYGNGLYVAAGENGVTAVSSNGMDWTISSAGAANFWYWGVAYGAGRFVAAATDANYNGPINIVTSTNGVEWTTATLPGGLPGYTELWDVGYGNGRFVAAGYFYVDSPYDEGVLILTSTDGLTWTRVTDPAIPDSGDLNFNNQYYLDVVRYDGTQWISAGDNELVMTSTDGLNWMVLPKPEGTTSDFQGLAFGAGGETTLVGRRAITYSTTNLTDWDNHFMGTYGDLSVIAYNGSQYLAGGSQAYLSQDGTTWPYYNPRLSIRGLAYGKGRWVASSWSISASTHYPLSSSTNGMDWELATTSSEFRDCIGVAFGNGIFVAIPKLGANTLAYSTDGINWTETTHPWFDAALDNDSLTFGDGQFFAWGYSNSTSISVVVSTDGMNWQMHDTGIDVFPLPRAAAYGDGRWILVGYDGNVITTTNLTNWSDQTIQFGGDTYNLLDIAYGGGHWIIVGADQHIWSSTDGEHWDEAFTTQMTGWSFSGVAFDGSSFWVVGSEGAIYQSQSLVTMTAPALAIRGTGNPNEVDLLIDGAAGQMWDLVHSPMLPASSWSYQTTITLTNDHHIHPLTLPDNASEGFYRLKQP